MRTTNVEFYYFGARISLFLFFFLAEKIFAILFAHIKHIRTYIKHI